MIVPLLPTTYLSFRNKEKAFRDWLWGDRGTSNSATTMENSVLWNKKKCSTTELEEDKDESVTSVTWDDSIFSSSMNDADAFASSSSLSSSSSASASSVREERSVQFREDPVLVTILTNHRTEEEFVASWMTLQDIQQNRIQAYTQQIRLLQDPQFREAIELIKNRLDAYGNGKRKHDEEEEDHPFCFYQLVDLDDCENNNQNDYYYYYDEAYYKQEEKTIAILTQQDSRGLERSLLNRRLGAKMHARIVTEAYRNGMSPEAIAALCRQRSEPAQAWARTMGLADAQASARYLWNDERRTLCFEL